MHPVRLYESENLLNTMLDLGAQVSVIHKDLVEEYREMWKCALNIDGRMRGFSREKDQGWELDKLVPIKVAMGADVTTAVWTLAVPMEEIPFNGVKLVLDNITVNTLNEIINMKDPRRVVIKIRSWSEVDEMVRMYSEADMTNTLTHCCNRHMQMEKMDPFAGTVKA